MQRLGGRIEELSPQHLSSLEYEHFLLVLQHLKEKAVEVQAKVEGARDPADPQGERSRLGGLQKELISVMPMMGLVRSLVQMEALYRGNQAKDGGINKAKQREIRVSRRESRQSRY